MLKDLSFLGFALLSWGWLCHTGWVAVGLLVIIAASKSSSWRWYINPRYCNRWGDASTLLTVLLLVYVFLYQSTPDPIFVLLKCLPVLYAPVLFAQIFSREQKLPLSVLFYSLRRRDNTAVPSIDMQLPYAGLTVLSAGAANVKGGDYFLIAVSLFVAVIGSVKPRQSPFYLWLPVVALAVFSSHFGHQGLKLLQLEIEKRSLEWLSDWHNDPFKSHTSIGAIGELKLSDKIVFRMKANYQMLLHQSSYDRYLGQNWIASRRAFGTENPEKAKAGVPLEKLEILQEFDGAEVLALPDGTVKISVPGNNAKLQYTELGTVEAKSMPEFARFQVFYTGKRTGKPTAYDLEVPKQHQDWLKTVSKAMKLPGVNPNEIAQRLASYFHYYFHYSLYLGEDRDPDAALRDFMLKRKAGHCEYFAVASVLLLRHMGIPARLANGYSVQEYDADLDMYLVRQRHSHAWALAYIDGLWQAVDSTPASWLAAENENAGAWQPLADWWSNSLFRFKQWRLRQTEQQKRNMEFYTALALSAYLALRLYIGKRKKLKTPQKTQNKTFVRHLLGGDSEFYRIDNHFKNTPKARLNTESGRQWLQRIQETELTGLLKLHEQLRFDPQGLSDGQRQDLREGVSTWLAQRHLFK